MGLVLIDWVGPRKWALVLIGWVGPKVNGFGPNRLGWSYGRWVGPKVIYAIGIDPTRLK